MEISLKRCCDRNPNYGTIGNLVCGFVFLLSVFATHTLTVLERAAFYRSVGINPYEYNVQVIEKTNETAARAFPVILNTKHPDFLSGSNSVRISNLKWH